MPRKPGIETITRLELHIPENLRVKLDLLLVSELEGRVPKGKYSEFFLERLVEYLEHSQLDLTPYAFPIGSKVSGPKAVIALLKERLEIGQSYK